MAASAVALVAGLIDQIEDWPFGTGATAHADHCCHRGLEVRRERAAFAHAQNDVMVRTWDKVSSARPPQRDSYIDQDAGQNVG